MFQSSFELTGYITFFLLKQWSDGILFQSSFELTGYITLRWDGTVDYYLDMFQSSFELTGYITINVISIWCCSCCVSKLFRAYGLYNLFFNWL